MLSRFRYSLPHLVMLGFSIGLYFIARQIDTSNTGGRIGPDFWPKAVTIFMGVVCLFEVVKRWVLWEESTPGCLPDSAMPSSSSGGASNGNLNAQTSESEMEYPGLLVTGTALVVGYVVIVPWLGFFLTTALFLASFTWVGGFRRPLWTATISLGGALFMVVIFMRVAYISLPLGIGPFQTLSVTLLRVLGVN